MLCKKGILLQTRGTRVPCGQCLPCRINRGRKWSARILMEWITNESGYFLTFTIDTPNLDYVSDTDGVPLATLNKKSALKWLDNCKRDLGAFRYYFIGEYGDSSFRPHYHMALFPSERTQVGAIRARWKKGFTQVSELNPERARYLANYTAKKLTKAGDERLRGREPEFRTSSRTPPLGAAFADRIITFYQQPRWQQLIEERGDVPRTFRVAGSIYPIGDWVLKRIRTGLGIPVTHTERLTHPRYEEFNPLLEAEWLPEEATTMEKQINAKKTQRLNRSTTVNL